MEEIARLDHVYQYNELMGIETLHPLVSVIDMSKCPRMRHSRRLYGFYCIFLKDVKCGDLRYGRNYYDYQEGTLVFTAPGQVVGVEDNGEVFQPKGWALLFHPDLIRGTSLGRNIGRYTFFSYESYEALHLSEQERHVVIDCLQNIAGDLAGTDDARRLAVHVEPHQAVQREIPVARAPVGTVDFAVERQHQRHGMFRDGMGRIGRNAHDGDAVFGRGLQVYVVEAGATKVTVRTGWITILRPT